MIEARAVADALKAEGQCEPSDTVSVVVVVGPDGRGVVAPYTGDAMLWMMAAGAPLHQA